ncbi:hypothetical protein [Mesorhizobium sp. ANAO-SY3R2]|uniref:hypothetical protein n=1 Tax=Mesorhizobium sp. ANAO-SY3R2 TaxID=3166644 RepID=UPI00366AE1E9
MNEERIEDAARLIASRKRAMAWLEKFGPQLDGRQDGQPVFSLRPMKIGGGQDGAVEAMELLAAYARFELPQIVKSALSCCRNDIDIARAQIRVEVGRGET